jgi:Na+-driven multidrug efflux pump
VASSAITLLIRNDEHPTIAMLIMVFGALLNIALNYYFLAVLSIGISGAAIATVISMVVVCLLSAAYFLSSKSQLIKFTLNLADFNNENIFKCLSINRQMTKGILVTGSSVMAMYIYSGFVIALHNKLFAQYGNTASLSAFAIVGYLMAIYYMLAEGIGDGVQPLLSFFYGQKRVDIIYKLMKISLVIVFMTGIVIYLILNIWPEFFVMLFNGDAQVMNKAITGIKYHLAGMYLDGLIVLMTVYFMAVQRGWLALSVSVANMLIQIPFLFWFSARLDELGIWLALPVSNVVMIIIIVPIFVLDLRKRLRIISLSKTTTQYSV